MDIMRTALKAIDEFPDMGNAFHFLEQHGMRTKGDTELPPYITMARVAHLALHLTAKDSAK